MKNRIITNTCRTIKKSLSRFISLLIMSLLGVFVFAGLQATAPDMILTLDQYLDKYNTYDIEIISVAGLTNKDVEKIESIKGIDAVEGSFSQDTIVLCDDKNVVVNVASLPKNINKLKLIEGRMPQSSGEIVVEENFIKKNKRSIGDKITLESQAFIEKEVTIVGTVDSSLYFNSTSVSQNRGNTNIGTGKINYYAYGLADNYVQKNYSGLYVTVNGAKKLTTSDRDYVDLIDDMKDAVEAVLENSHMSYIYDRSDCATYSNYIDDANSIANLSKIFPVLFFAVAVLVSLISMNRMVEEDRQEIGTLKSLGFSNRTIMLKYVVFSFFATFIGGVIGSVLGLMIIPSIIFMIYGILFDVPDFVLGLNLTSTLFGFFITVICVCGTSILTVYKELREKPSELMRPKAPKSGKRVLLERVKFIWKRIRFSQKVVIRNIFRYKKRVIVTVGGIAGCTALMLCGFGIRDAITDIADMQYNEIFKFDGTAYLGMVNERYDEIFNLDEIEEITLAQRSNVTVNDVESLMLIAEDNQQMSEVINLKDTDTGETINLEPGKVVITEKLARLNELHSGDTVEIVQVDHQVYQYEISGIVKNYIGHYIFMDRQTYEQSAGTYMPNVVYINTKSDRDYDKLAEKLLDHEGVLTVSFKSYLIQNVDDMLESLNSVVLILIVLASILSFVVLYNLSNININERKREIATLKVLGFYDKEVDGYITKENIIFTFIGIIIGLVLGYFLTRTVIATVEIETCRFLYKIKWMSYVYATVLSVIFTIVINWVTHFKLKGIDMIDSLKSVE